MEKGCSGGDGGQTGLWKIEISLIFGLVEEETHSRCVVLSGQAPQAVLAD